MGWVASENLKDYRENKTRVYNTIVKNNLHLNTIILTVSIASLTAVAALSSEVFKNYPWLSLVVIALFICVILLSTINFYLSSIALRDVQKNLTKDILFTLRVSSGQYKPPLENTQKALNNLVLAGFCAGLIMFLILLCCYIFGGAA